jgi:endonuclease III
MPSLVAHPEPLLGHQEPVVEERGERGKQLGNTVICNKEVMIQTDLSAYIIHCEEVVDTVDTFISDDESDEYRCSMIQPKIFGYLQRIRRTRSRRSSTENQSQPNITLPMRQLTIGETTATTTKTTTKDANLTDTTGLTETTDLTKTNETETTKPTKAETTETEKNLTVVKETETGSCQTNDVDQTNDFNDSNASQTSVADDCSKTDEDSQTDEAIQTDSRDDDDDDDEDDEVTEESIEGIEEGSERNVEDEGSERADGVWIAEGSERVRTEEGIERDSERDRVWIAEQTTMMSLFLQIIVGQSKRPARMEMKEILPSNENRSMCAYLLALNMEGLVWYKKSNKPKPIRDGIVIGMLGCLFKQRALSTADIQDMSVSNLVGLLRPTAEFPYQKAAIVKCAAEAIVEGSFPTDLATLLTIPGVDTRVAEHIVHLTFGTPSFPMDQAVFQFCRVVGWCGDQEDPVAARHTIKGWLPKESWYMYHEIAATMVQLLADPATRCGVIEESKRIGCFHLVLKMLQFCGVVRVATIRKYSLPQGVGKRRKRMVVSRSEEWIQTQLQYLQRLKVLRKRLNQGGVVSIRDEWANALPKLREGDARLPFSVYLLMQNTKGVNDKISVHLWKTIYHQLKILFSVADISKMPMSRLVELLRPASMHYQNAGMMKCLCEILFRDYNGVMPRSLDELKLLPGIGHKIGSIITYHGYGLVSGIAMDRHVLKFSLYLSWCTSTSPDTAVLQLEDWLPRTEWGPINDLVAGTCQLLQDSKTRNQVMETATELGNETLELVEGMYEFSKRGSTKK